MSSVKHIKYMLDLCKTQKTISTSRLEKELLRIDKQYQSKIYKKNKQHSETVAALNRRAQIAENKLKNRK